VDGFIFLTADEVIFIHEDQLLRHGGAPGILNQGSLESAVSAAEFAAYYNPEADIHLPGVNYIHPSTTITSPHRSRFLTTSRSWLSSSL